MWWSPWLIADDLADWRRRPLRRDRPRNQELAPATRVEVLVPDFQGSRGSVETVVGAPVDIYNHNIETVPRLYKIARPGGRYPRSLEVLRHAKNTARGLSLGPAHQGRYHAWPG